jgi:hypothetical protein
VNTEKKSINKSSVELSSSAFCGVMLVLGYYMTTTSHWYLLIVQLAFIAVVILQVKSFAAVLQQYFIFKFLFILFCSGMGVIPLALTQFVNPHYISEFYQLCLGLSFFGLFVSSMLYFNVTKLESLGWVIKKTNH